jgi:hypothetical protein
MPEDRSLCSPLREPQISSKQELVIMIITYKFEAAGHETESGIAAAGNSGSGPSNL